LVWGTWAGRPGPIAFAIDLYQACGFARRRLIRPKVAKPFPQKASGSITDPHRFDGPSGIMFSSLGTRMRQTAVAGLVFGSGGKTRTQNCELVRGMVESAEPRSTFTALKSKGRSGRITSEKVSVTAARAGPERGGVKEGRLAPIPGKTLQP